MNLYFSVSRYYFFLRCRWVSGCREAVKKKKEGEEMEENGAHFFEGTEKLLEVWFSQQDESKGTGDLRDIPR